MENQPPKPPSFRSVASDWAISCFFGFGTAYILMRLDSTKSDVIEGMGLQFYVTTKAIFLLCAIACAIPGGSRLAKILWDFKKTGRLPANKKEE